MRQKVVGDGRKNKFWGRMRVFSDRFKVANNAYDVREGDHVYINSSGKKGVVGRVYGVDIYPHIMCKVYVGRTLVDTCMPEELTFLSRGE